jgi:thiol-disulfide isomerase/thioredoxin
MKYVLALTIFICIVQTTFSQNEPVPDYLTTQAFPDSVRSLGMQAPDGTRTSFGEVLEKYKGKKILVDIWASWCRDCIVGYPKLEELRRKAGEKHVAYVFLSADKDEQKWKNAIQKYNIRGDHYLLDGAWTNTLANYLVLDWVPRYLVLDENGKVIVPKAINANDASLKKAVE